MAWCGPPTRLVSAGNSISAGHQHICRKGRFNPVTILYSKTLMADLHGKCLPSSTDIHSGSVTEDI
ncbi:hypothetical protein DYJ25_08510 [Prevotella denticola]|nr:hypothetical protein DYJ25_08510 [Prevotella denticola]